jgi:hypothetical protein
MNAMFFQSEMIGRYSRADSARRPGRNQVVRLVAVTI